MVKQVRFLLSSLNSELRPHTCHSVLSSCVLWQHWWCNFQKSNATFHCKPQSLQDRWIQNYILTTSWGLALLFRGLVMILLHGPGAQLWGAFELFSEVSQYYEICCHQIAFCSVFLLCICFHVLFIISGSIQKKVAS